MRTTLRQNGDVMIVELCGKITIGGGDAALRSLILELLEGAHPTIVLNLEKVSYMDSAGLGELVSSHRRVVERGGTLALISSTERMRRLLQMTQIDRMLEIFRSEREALLSPLQPLRPPGESPETARL